MEAKDQIEDEDFSNESFIEKPAILDKYKAAAQVTNLALQKVLEKCVPGADIAELCEFGDNFILEEVKKVYNSKKAKKLERGISFPTCISVNNVCGHFSPLKDESVALKEGDVCKVDLGAHIDGYITQAAYTIVVRKNREEKVTGQKADLLKGTHTALQAAIRTFFADKKNTEVTETIKKATDTYKIVPMDGFFSGKVKKHMIDTADTIANRHNPEQKVEDYTFAPGDVFYLDIIVGTGTEGKARESEFRTTVFRRAIENTYLLKI